MKSRILSFVAGAIISLMLVLYFGYQTHIQLLSEQRAHFSSVELNTIIHIVKHSNKDIDRANCFANSLAQHSLSAIKEEESNLRSNNIDYTGLKEWYLDMVNEKVELYNDKDFQKYFSGCK